MIRNLWAPRNFSFTTGTALLQQSNLKLAVDLSYCMKTDVIFTIFVSFFQPRHLIMFLIVGQEPDIPDLIDFMQSGDELKIINAARFLQHLCYSKETVKDKVRYLVENAISTIYFIHSWLVLGSWLVRVIPKKTRQAKPSDDSAGINQSQYLLRQRLNMNCETTLLQLRFELVVWILL